MVNLPWKRDAVPVISAELKIRFIQPAKIGEQLHFRAEAEDASKRLIVTQGICRTAEGRLIAEASAKCVKIKNPNL
jgi:acyl-coenzyme A thioesterase PaaI-like protein